MKRLLYFILSVVLLSAIFNVESDATGIEHDEYYSIRIVDNVTNEEIDFEIVEDVFSASDAKMRMVGENELEVEYDAVIKFTIPEEEKDDLVMPFSSITTEQEEASIRAKLKITYFLSADKEEIKVTNVSGSWESLISTPIYFNDNEVMVTDGVPEPETEDNTLRAYPQSSSFSYDTGWDYVLKYPGSSDAFSGARAFSETTATIEGMGGSYTLFTTVVVP